MSRLQNLEGRFDVAIVGGGIIGAGIARDAALRGLRVALVEKDDFGSGTTAGSTRLIHGGLRYLESYDFRLVRMDLRERERLLRNASHLVKPLEFLVPIYGESWFHRARLRAGMALYDLLSYDKSLPNHRMLSAAEVARAEPELRREGLQGAALYYDAQVNSPERLTLENILDARAHGAAALNYVEATGALESDGAIGGLKVRCAITGEEAEVTAKLVVNASGPWFERVAARLAPEPKRLVRTTKGIHLACDPVSNKALVLFSKVDQRLFFVVPWLGYSWVGTTDTDYEGDPGAVRATREDVEYLVRSTRPFFPKLGTGAIHWTNAGVRALVMEEGSESSVSRMHRVTARRPGLVSVLGGKITGYRAIAEEVCDVMARKLGTDRKAQTADEPLPGARAKPSGTEPLDSLYGCRADDVRRLAQEDSALSMPLAPNYPDIAAQVLFAVREEQCERVADFMLRRSLLGFTQDQGRNAVGRVAALMAAEHGWSAARRLEEISRYQLHLEASMA